MPRWNDGLVNAFPIPDEYLAKLSLSDARDVSQAEKPKEDGIDTTLAESVSSDKSPFPFFTLPAELRNRIYHLVLFTKPPYRLVSRRKRASRTAILLVSKRFHQEAAYTLYTTHKFLVFPVQEFTALPVIYELPRQYRTLVSSLAMTVGPSWTDPPKTWEVTSWLRKCLAGLTNVQTLSIFVEFDPSHPIFQRFRISENFYTDFCGNLLGDVLDAMPQLRYVQLDGNSSVDVNGPLVSRLRAEALDQEKEVRWGKKAGWAHASNHTTHTVTAIKFQKSEDATTLTTAGPSSDKLSKTKASRSTKLGRRNTKPQNKLLQRVKDDDLQL